MMFEVEESGGFEPPEAYTSTVFETVPFVRSGNSPDATLHNAPRTVRTHCFARRIGSSRPSFSAPKLAWGAAPGASFSGSCGSAAGGEEGREQLGGCYSFDAVVDLEGVAQAGI